MANALPSFSVLKTVIVGLDFISPIPECYAGWRYGRCGHASSLQFSEYPPPLPRPLNLSISTQLSLPKDLTRSYPASLALKLLINQIDLIMSFMHFRITFFLEHSKGQISSSNLFLENGFPRALKFHG